jgi:hypothetical protein
MVPERGDGLHSGLEHRILIRVRTVTRAGRRRFDRLHAFDFLPVSAAIALKSFRRFARGLLADRPAVLFDATPELELLSVFRFRALQPLTSQRELLFREAVDVSMSVFPFFRDRSVPLRTRKIRYENPGSIFIPSLRQRRSRKCPTRCGDTSQLCRRERRNELTSRRISSAHDPTHECGAMGSGNAFLLAHRKRAS